MNKKTQKSGDNSVQIQAENVNLGPNVKEVKEICGLVFEANFPRLKEAAAEEATKKAGELVGALTEKLAQTGFNTLENLSSPRKQDDLYVAQKGFAKSDGNEDLKGILVNLISSSLGEVGDSNFNSILFSEAIEVASKLSTNDFKILVATMLLNDLRFQVSNLEGLITVTTSYAKKLDLVGLNVPDVAFTNLEYHRCLQIEPLQKKLFFPFMRQKYPSLFSRGHSKEDIERKLGAAIEELIAQKIICACLRDPSLYQIAALGREELKKMDISEDIKSKAEKLLSENLMGDDDVKNSISGKDAELDIFIKKWDNSALSMSRLSPVGKAIAHTYLGSKIEKMPPLTL